MRKTILLLLALTLGASTGRAQEKPAIPLLIKALGDDDHAQEAFARLRARGQEARAGLVAELNASAPAATADQTAAIAKRLGQLDEPDAAVRKAARAALIGLGAVAIPRLQLAAAKAPDAAKRKRAIELIDAIDSAHERERSERLRHVLALVLFADLARPADAPLLRRQLAFAQRASLEAVAADYALRHVLGGGPALVMPDRWRTDPAAPARWDAVLAAPPKPAQAPASFTPAYPAGPIARGVRLHTRLRMAADESETQIGATQTYDLTQRDGLLVRSVTRHDVLVQGKGAPKRKAGAKGFAGKQLALSPASAAKDRIAATGDELDQVSAPGHLLAFALPAGDYPAGRARAMAPARVRRLLDALLLGADMLKPLLGDKPLLSGSARWIHIAEGQPPQLFVSYRAVSIHNDQLVLCFQQGSARCAAGRLTGYQLGGALINVPLRKPRGGFIRPISFDVVGLIEHTLHMPKKGE